MFDNDHLTKAYDTGTTPSAHGLACVFLVMALGVMFDLNREPCMPHSLLAGVCILIWNKVDARGEELFALGQACLGAVGMEHACPATVQALHLCGTYILNDKRELLSLISCAFTNYTCL